MAGRRNMAFRDIYFGLYTIGAFKVFWPTDFCFVLHNTLSAFAGFFLLGQVSEKQLNSLQYKLTDFFKTVL